MRNAIRLLGLAALIAASVSCGDVSRQGSSPVYLVIDTLSGLRGGPTAGTAASSLNSDVITNITTPAPCTPQAPCPTIFGDGGSVSLRAPLKDVASGVTPTSNNEVTINRYHVTYIRADGHNTQGIDVPYAFDGAVTVTIPGGGTASTGFELVRLTAKEEAPLVQLKQSNNFISAIAQVTFYGVDRTGNAVSVMGQIGIQFGNFGDF